MDAAHLSLIFKGLLQQLGLQEIATWLGQTPLMWPHLAEPRWLLILLLPLILLIVRWRQRQRLVHYADPALAPWALQPHSGHTAPGRRRIAAAVFALFWIFLAISLANPRVPSSASEQVTLRAPVLFVIDDSAAMSVADVSPNRQARSQQLMELLIKALPNRRLGLMVYADQAGLLLPPSPDHRLLQFFLRQIPGLDHPVRIPQPDQALTWAATLPDFKGGVVVWLTSADQASFVGAAGSRQLQAAERLKQAGLRLIAVTEAGSGGPLMAKGLPIKDSEGNELISRPDPQRVAELARITGGAAAVTTTLPADAAFIHQQIERQPDLSPKNIPLDQTRSLHTLTLLLAALSLVLAGFLAFARRRTTPPSPPAALLGVLTALIISQGLGAPPAHAANGDINAPRDAASSITQAADRSRIVEGHQALSAGDFARAQVLFSAAKGYEARLGSGAAAYRRADFPFAVDQFQMALWTATTPTQRALALFNLGDALVMTGRYQAALDAFNGVLARQPDNTDARKNRDLVAKLLEKSAKNAKDSPKFKGYQSATYGYYHEPTTSKMDQQIQQSSGAVGGTAGQATPSTATAQEPFQVTEAIAASARKKLDLVNDQPAPLLDGLLRQQPYHDPFQGETP